MNGTTRTGSPLPMVSWDVHERAAAVFERSTSRWSDWHVAALLEAKGDCRVSVVIPARDKQRTIAGIVDAIRFAERIVVRGGRWCKGIVRTVER